MFRFVVCLLAMATFGAVWSAETESAAKDEKTAPTVAAKPKVDKAVAKENKGERIWIVPEYYGAMTKESPYPNFPLVTYGNPDPFAFPNSGILGEAGTTVAFDRKGEDFGFQHGFKLTAGGWITEDQKWGAELSGFFQPKVEGGSTFAMGGPGSDNLGVPLFDVVSGGEAVVFYGPGAGRTAAIDISNKQQFWGVGAMGLMKIQHGEHVGLDLKFGLRYTNIEDEFGFAQNSAGTDAVTFADRDFDAGGVFSVVDSFKANNDFIGGDLGVRVSFKYGRFRAEIQPKIALGGNMQEVEIRGRSVGIDGGTGTVYAYNGGFWAQDTNIGDHNRTRFCVVPEINVKVGVEITKNLEFQAGYGITYWSDVVTAGKHVSRNINMDKIAIDGYGPDAADPLYQAPTFKFHSSDFWAHGVTAGFKIKF